LLEPRRITELNGWTPQVEQALAVEPAKSGEELLAENGAQCRNWQQEQRMGGVDPAPMISRQSAGGNDGVDMVMGTPTATIP